MSHISLFLHCEPDDEIEVTSSLDHGTANEVLIGIGRTGDDQHVVMSAEQADDLAIKLQQAAADVYAARDKAAAHQEVT